jgi:Fe-S-cluster containining protein
MSFDYPKRLRFKCGRCALCCADTKDRKRRILITKIEGQRISKKTQKAFDEFAEKTEDLASAPYIYRMRKTADRKCVFLRDTACTIYRARPIICRFYPFELKSIGNRHVFAYTRECPCIGKGPELKKTYFKKLFAQSLKLTRKNSNNDRHGDKNDD